MNLKIGEKIRELRNNTGITQEELAEILGVSNQSVSRWELGICYPDIELLPSLANYFNVTLDELVCMNEIRSEKMMNKFFTEAIDYEREEKWKEAADVLRKALKLFPLNDGISAELALALSKNGNGKDLNEAIEISEALLKRCTEEKIRSTVKANLCFLYKSAGLYEKAIETGKSLPHIWECREILVPSLVENTGREEALKRSFNIFYQVLRDVALEKEISFSIGYKPEANVKTENLVDFVKK